MIELPEKIENEGQLEELISYPGEELIKMISGLSGDIMILGINGKIGPSLARMAARACEMAGVKKRITGVDREQNAVQQEIFKKMGIETIHGDLLNPGFINSLPQAENVFFLAGMKFGSVDNLPLTWAINSYLPAMVAERFKSSKIAAFSTGCVYPLVPVSSGGSTEKDPPEAIGEYAQSCLGRERMFEFGSTRYNTKVTLIRLNYSVEMRYGVLVDVASKVKNSIPIDLSMGYFNAIWQGDVNDAVLRSISLASSPARIINLTGTETLSVHDVAIEFGKQMGIKPVFVGKESETALLSNADEAHKLFGKPKVPATVMIKWISGWLNDDRRLLGKPTHFEVRNGKY